MPKATTTKKSTGSDVTSGATRKKRAKMAIKPTFKIRMRNRLSHMSKKAFLMRNPNMEKPYHAAPNWSNCECPPAGGRMCRGSALTEAPPDTIISAAFDNDQLL